MGKAETAIAQGCQVTKGIALQEVLPAMKYRFKSWALIYSICSRRSNLAKRKRVSLEKRVSSFIIAKPPAFRAEDYVGVPPRSIYARSWCCSG